MLLCMFLLMLLCILLRMLLCMLLCMLSSLTHPIPQSSPALSCLGTRHSPAFSCSAPQLGCLHFCSFLLTSLPLFAPSFAFLFRLIRCSASPLFCSALVLGRSGRSPLAFDHTGPWPLQPRALSALSTLSHCGALALNGHFPRTPSLFLVDPFTSLADPFTSLAETFTSLTWLHFFISIDSLHAVCCTQVSISAAPGAKTPRRLTFPGDQRLWRVTQSSRLLRRSAAPVPSSSCAWPPRRSAAQDLERSDPWFLQPSNAPFIGPSATPPSAFRFSDAHFGARLVLFSFCLLA